MWLPGKEMYEWARASWWQKTNCKGKSSSKVRSWLVCIHRDMKHVFKGKNFTRLVFLLSPIFMSKGQLWLMCSYCVCVYYMPGQKRARFVGGPSATIRPRAPSAVTPIIPTRLYSTRSSQSEVLIPTQSSSSVPKPKKKWRKGEEIPMWNSMCWIFSVQFVFVSSLCKWAVCICEQRVFGSQRQYVW